MTKSFNMQNNNWISCKTSLPENGVVVETKIDDGNPVTRGGVTTSERNVCQLRRMNRLWFLNDGVYVYYEPTHWRAVQSIG